MKDSALNLKNSKASAEPGFSSRMWACNQPLTWTMPARVFPSLECRLQMLHHKPREARGLKDYLRDYRCPRPDPFRLTSPPPLYAGRLGDGP